MMVPGLAVPPLVCGTTTDEKNCRDFKISAVFIYSRSFIYNNFIHSSFFLSKVF